MTSVSTDVQQFRPEDVWHTYNRKLAFGTITIGDGDGRVALFFRDTATIDAMVTHLAELKAELLAAQEPVITDSERTCDQANPGSGAWCHRGGDHGVHRDTDGEQWRTDGEGLSWCECGHSLLSHDEDGAHECVATRCPCAGWRAAKPKAATAGEGGVMVGPFDDDDEPAKATS